MIHQAESADSLCKAAAFFSGWNETMILSCLQGVMGKIFVSDHAAAAYLGDFCFLAGEPDPELLLFWPDSDKQLLIMVPRDSAWEEEIQKLYPKNSEKRTRYAIKKDTKFNIELLHQLKDAIPDGFLLDTLHESDVPFVQNHPDFRDWIAQFRDFTDYQARGLGCIVRHNGQIVAGASCYSVYQNGIEIEIQTLKEYRRMGLATSAAAGLILECLDRGLYPSWDAANLSSLHLAEKLGYELDCAYPAYYIRR